ncbi:hypothetical protein NBRC10512_008177 [Rhodotorula toruloides]|uniref:RHTO0S04e07624g1_1 n=2 Tax=Rhodotorula toruloides TaxID=5286 RepID=A0A061AW96_RHOTO|nr:DUF602 family, zinc finger protein [Rhodotorula toruloides NP11]EMS21213.1 DUF602 family, zinc finger protein [Rhodotorula toruloides NP11]CDR39667.1 RHTO0S04e07624g1_1 [Rhodotorula toruloides]
MGNDGGSIPKRVDLVKSKQKRVREDDKDRVRQLWAFCALSKQPLRQPVVSCPYGRLYNKEAIISYLLNPPTASDTSTPFGSDGQLVAGHIRSLKDVTTLRLTPNPALEGEEDETRAGDNPPAQFVCPISLREMNGSVRFVYRKLCGCVMSEAALREMRRGMDKKGSNGEDKGELGDERVCPVDGERSEVKEDWVTINPKEDELEEMKIRWEARKKQEKEDRKAAKAAKRKNGDAAPAADDGDDRKAKKTKTDKLAAAAEAQAKAAAPAIKAGSSVAGLSASLQAKLAEQKKQQSPAIASLYRTKPENEMKDKDGRSNWMTIGAYSRF